MSRVLAALCVLVGAAAIGAWWLGAGSSEGDELHYAVPPGQEELLAEILGHEAGRLAGGCVFQSASATFDRVRARYRCGESGELAELELRHPGAVGRALARSEKLAVLAGTKGPPPEGLAEAVAARAREREERWRWTRARRPEATRSGPPTPRGEHASVEATSEQTAAAASPASKGSRLCPVIRTTAGLLLACLLGLALVALLVRGRRRRARREEDTQAAVRRSTFAALVVLYVAFTAATSTTAIWRIESGRSQWPLDFSFTTHNIHAVAECAPRLTLLAGPGGTNVLHQDHFQPIRLLFVLAYSVAPHVYTILILKCALMGLGVIGSFLLGRHYGRSDRAGLYFAAVYALTPGVFNCAHNEMYLIQLVIPMFILAYYSLVSDKLGWFVLWGAFALACREEVLVLFGLLFVHQLATTRGRAWRRLLAVGLLMLAHFGALAAYTLAFFPPDWDKGESLLSFWTQRGAGHTGLSAAGLVDGLHAAWSNLSLVFVVAAFAPRLFICALVVLAATPVHASPSELQLIPGGAAGKMGLRYDAIPMAVFMAAFIEAAATRWRWLSSPSRRRARIAAIGAAFMLLAMAHATARNATNLSTLLQPGGSSEEHAFLRELEARTHEEDAVVATYDALPLFSTRDRIYNVEQHERWFDEELDDIIPSADLLILRGKHGDLRRLAEATGAFVEVPAPGDLVVLRRANREPRGRR